MTPAKKEGRPTLYKPELCTEVDRYLESTGREQTTLPTMQGLALRLKVDGDTLVEWAKRYPEFSAAIKKLMMRQAEQLINDGIYGGKEINATIIKLLLQNNHGMKERLDATSGGEPIKSNAIVFMDFSNGTEGQ